MGLLSSELGNAQDQISTSVTPRLSNVLDHRDACQDVENWEFVAWAIWFHDVVNDPHTCIRISSEHFQVALTFDLGLKTKNQYSFFMLGDTTYKEYKIGDLSL